MKVGAFCACGAGLEGEISPDAAALRAVELFRQAHCDAGCQPCDRATAVQAARASE